MKLLFKVEDAFDIPEVGCAIIPSIPRGIGFRVPVADRARTLSLIPENPWAEIEWYERDEKE